MASPEETGQYQCPSCGNTRSFVGYDDRGYPGPDDCECGKGVCECEVTLKQHFTVDDDGSIDYRAFVGGGRGAEIGDYTHIQCAVCGKFFLEDTMTCKEYQVIWEIDLTANSPREAAERALAIQRNPDSMATVFVVADEEGNIEHIDLEDSADDQVEPVRQTPTGKELLPGTKVVSRRKRGRNVITVSKSDWAEIYYAVELKRLRVAEDNRKNGRFADGVDLAVWRRQMEHIADALGPDGELMHDALTVLLESADRVTLRWAETDLQFAVQELDAALAPFGFGRQRGKAR